MKKSKQLQKLVRKSAEVSFKEGKLVESQVMKSIKFLRSQPRSQAIMALSEYLKELKRKEREHTMYIETIIPLSHIQLNKMKKIVEKKVKITKTKVFVNPEILGGFRLKVGDEIWDQSILGKLNQIKEAIAGVGSN